VDSDLSDSSPNLPISAEALEFVYLELSVKCNLRCHFCDNSMRNLYRDITPEQYRGVIDQLRPGTRLGLHGLGEPTLHKNLVELIAYAKQRGLYVYFNTNHTVTTDEQMHGFVDHELDELRISMSAATSASFAAYAGRDLFDALLQRCARMVAIRGDARRPVLRAVFVLTRQNHDQLGAVLRHAEDLGLDELMVQTHLDWGKEPAPEESPGGCRVKGDELAAVRRQVAAQARGARRIRVILPFPIDGSEPEPGRPGSCRWPFNATWITAGGEMTPCCNLHDPRQISFGNAFRTPVAKLWLNRDYQEFRRRYRQNAVEACRSCPVHLGQFKSYAYQAGAD
jgi:radical SAM protein with 4Fe4S-binding SPASM domain